MESGHAIAPRSVAGPSEDEWSQWMDFVREEYLVKDRGIEEVFESLKQLNPQVKLVLLYRGFFFHTVKG